jgi:hypothetical protein
MNTATITAKRPVCQRSLNTIARGRRQRRTHENEDAIHVALPTFHEGLVIPLTLLKNDAPELCGRIHALDLCESHLRKRLGEYMMAGVP